MVDPIELMSTIIYTLRMGNDLLLEEDDILSRAVIIKKQNQMLDTLQNFFQYRF